MRLKFVLPTVNTIHINRPLTAVRSRMQDGYIYKCFPAVSRQLRAFPHDERQASRCPPSPAIHPCSFSPPPLLQLPLTPVILSSPIIIPFSRPSKKQPAGTDIPETPLPLTRPPKTLFYHLVICNNPAHPHCCWNSDSTFCHFKYQLGGGGRMGSDRGHCIP